MFKGIRLHNFKCARELSIKLESLTILTGLNGSGKSTILQAIALLKQSIFKYTHVEHLIVRGELVSLGRSEDIRFEGAQDDNIAFDFKTTDGYVKITAIASSGTDTLPLKWEGDLDSIRRLFEKGFQFIQADRITPATQYKQASTPEQSDGWLGCGGEYTADFLNRNESIKVSSKRFCRDDVLLFPEGLLKQIAPTESLLDQTAGWLQHLSPGVRPRAIANEIADSTSLRFSYTGTQVDSGSREHRPTNVGFGITYCLPIIVACLSAPKGSLLLLENPEAHLHPRGQYALGKLLALCASDGVQIIVETHSDHLLNGVRLAAKRSEIPSNDVAVHFFSRNIENGESTVISPILHSNGRFNEWPDGFFDEWSKALDELLDI